MLPHERPEEVVEHVERVLADLRVESYTEVTIGKRIALRLLQQRRLEQIEARRLKAEVDLRLDDTDEGKSLVLAERTLLALQTLTSVMTRSFSTDRQALNELLEPISTVVEMVAQVEATGPRVFVGHASLKIAVDRLRETTPSETEPEAYTGVIGAAQTALAGVETVLPGARAVVEMKRIEIAGQMPLPDDRDAKLRRRYAGDLERRLAADMRLLAALREQRVAAGASGSLGQAPEVHVRLVR